MKAKAELCKGVRLCESPLFFLTSHDSLCKTGLTLNYCKLIETYHLLQQVSVIKIVHGLSGLSKARL